MTITGPVNQTLAAPAVNHFSVYFKFLPSKLVFIYDFIPKSYDVGR